MSTTSSVSSRPSTPRRARLVVVGSSNTDMVVRTPHIPVPGETVMGGDFLMNPGGKGANQAVAAARLGGDVTFVARVGADSFGTQARAGFERDGIRTAHVISDSAAPSGVALICVAASGENSIVVAPGANARLSPADVEAARPAFIGADWLLVQLEVPLPAVERAVDLAREHGVRVLLNPAPAPATPLPAALLASVDVLTPNQSEAAQLCGLPPGTDLSPEDLARRLLARGVRQVVMTLGAAGGLVADASGCTRFAAAPVHAVDTTAAGDCFSGALAVALGEGQALPAAVRFAALAAGISVTRQGAQASLPTRAEVAGKLAG